MMKARTAVVVEDDHDVGDAISQLLDLAGFDVAVARTGADALSLISERQPDLVTLDLTLPDIDGVEVCRRIRTTSDCYVIVVSGRTAEVNRLIGLEVGADDYLVKPFSMRELQARVAALFRRPRSSDPVPASAAAPTADPLPDPDPTSSEGCSDLTLNRGSREVRVFDGRPDGLGDVSVPVVPVPVLGTTVGCGDAFVAGFLGAWRRSRDVLAAVQAGKRLGAAATAWRRPLPDEAYGLEAVAALAAADEAAVGSRPG